MKKRLLSLLLVLAVVFSFSLSAFATDTGIDIIDDPLSYYFENQMLGVQKGTGVTLVCPKCDYKVVYTGGTLVTCPYDGEALVLADLAGVHAEKVPSGIGRKDLPGYIDNSGTAHVSKEGKLKFVAHPCWLDVGEQESNKFTLTDPYKPYRVQEEDEDYGLYVYDWLGYNNGISHFSHYTQPLSDDMYYGNFDFYWIIDSGFVPGTYYVAADQPTVKNFYSKYGAEPQILKTKAGEYNLPNDSYWGLGNLGLSDYNAVWHERRWFYAENAKSTSIDIYLYPFLVTCDPTENPVEEKKEVTIEDNKFTGNIYVDNSTNITYIYPKYTTVRSSSAITANIWPEDCYVSLNVVYKMSKNHQKLLKTLKKHKKKLLEYADIYADEGKKNDIESNDIALRSYEAFSAIKQFFDEKLEADKLKDVIEPAIMIQRMLSKSKEIFDNHLVVDKCDYAENGDLVAYIKSYAVFDYLKALLGTDSNGYEINQDVLCAADFGAPQKRKRFIVIGIKKSLTDTVQLPIGIFSEKDYRTVQDAIGDLQNVPTVTDVAEDIGTPLKKADDISELGKSLRDTDTLFNHIITKTRETAMERFKAIKQGENFHSLNDSLKTNTYTDANRTQNTIYLRLAYNQPSGTVVNVRKSMWIHPELNRAISIREAARLQTFPDSFIFCGSKDKQYQQVGNAVPPIMAKAIAEKLADQLEQIEKRFER